MINTIQFKKQEKVDFMIKVIQGDLFKSSAQTIVNPINCRGAMGKGLAKLFKNKYTNMYRDYYSKCQAGVVKVGQPYLHREESTWILNFPTKDDWRNPSKMEYITEGLEHFKNHYKQWGVTSIAFPALGSGEGGLNWDEVQKTMIESLKDLDIDIEIYSPQITKQLF